MTNSTTAALIDCNDCGWQGYYKELIMDDFNFETDSNLLLCPKCEGGNWVYHDDSDHETTVISATNEAQ